MTGEKQIPIFIFRKDKNNDLKHYRLVDLNLVCQEVMEWLLLKHIYVHKKAESAGK